MKYTESDFRNYVLLKKGTIISTFSGMHHFIQVRCNEGHIWCVQPYKMLNGHSWCAKCFHKNFGSHISQKTKEKFLDILVRKHATLESSYVNSSTKVTIKDALEHTWQVRPYYIMLGGWCPICANEERNKRNKQRQQAIQKDFSKLVDPARTRKIAEIRTSHNITPITVCKIVRDFTIDVFDRAFVPSLTLLGYTSYIDAIRQRILKLVIHCRKKHLAVAESNLISVVIYLTIPSICMCTIHENFHISSSALYSFWNTLYPAKTLGAYKSQKKHLKLSQLNEVY